MNDTTQVGRLAGVPVWRIIIGIPLASIIAAFCWCGLAVRWFGDECVAPALGLLLRGRV